MWSFFLSLPQPVWIAVGALLIVLGLSFCYKGWNATVLGRIHYWSGFLPITLISPWFIHFPPGERSLVKMKEGLLCHMLVGPLFFLTAVPLLVVGADLAGLPGTPTVNFIINAGDKSKPAAITYSPPFKYAFPIAIRSGKTINKLFNTQIYEDPSKALVGVEHKNAQSAADRYGTSK